MTRLVLFDLDGTLLRAPSSERRFVRWLLRQRLIGVRALAHSLAFAVRWAPRCGLQVWKKNKAYLTGLEAARVSEWAERFVDSELIPNLIPTVVERLRAHQAAADAVVLLTGTPDFIAAPLAARLSIPRFRATQCAQREGIFVPAPPLVHPFGAEKLQIAKELCAELALDLSEAVAYADAFKDLPLLERVGRAVVVEPDARLASAVGHRGWEVVRT